MQNPDPLSQRLLQQIETFSGRFLARLKLPAEGSPHGGNEALRPLGLVLHYTADPRLETVLRWFCDAQSLSSGHYVVSQSLHPWHRELSSDLSEVAALPVTVVQMRPLQNQAWHATWSNRWAFGVEMCNSGELRPDASGELRPVAQVPYDPNLAPMLTVGQRHFAGYPESQMLATLVVCRCLAQCYPMSPARVVGHDMIQGEKTKVRGALNHDKRDVGGLCLEAWRKAMFGPPEAIPNPLVPALIKKVEPGIYQGPRVFDFHLAKLRLEALGYAVDPLSVAWPPSEADSVGLFQVLMGLVPDRLCGPKTQAALYSRCADRFEAPR